MTEADMPRYFFDSGDHQHLVEDNTGLECEGIEAARNAAVEGLTELAKDELKGPDGQQLIMDIRDESGRKVLRLSLWLVIEPLEVNAVSPTSNEDEPRRRG
ncbi:hypothetical protein [Mesorhizobium sp.]|uniref:DUF6894 family protein n=1 Tax=Mesorhizobium sp. TaxID=1871066 RepID=UPI00257CF6D4|nr:hypothetical protein [Mesorhizobium sp.]